MDKKPCIVVSHPTNNAFARAVLKAFFEAGALSQFFTTIALCNDEVWQRALPKPLRRQFERRAVDLPARKVTRFPWEELERHVKKGAYSASFNPVDRVYTDLDRRVAERLPRWQQHGANTVYAYEDGAWQSFQAARGLGMQCVYDLPIAYWETAMRLLTEEAERYPEWEPTLGATRDSAQKQERKTREAESADVIVTPSKFVHDSLPETIKVTKDCLIAPFGSPLVPPPGPKTPGPTLKVLFAGSLGQRKGLADLMAAVRLLGRRDVELTLVGSRLMPEAFYHQQGISLRLESPRPHGEILELMQAHDVFVLPSIVEGRALVQQEAMACGLPLIVTPNAGGEDLIEEGRTGFLVPIRTPEAIAAKLDWLADHRQEALDMGEQARRKAETYTWEGYSQQIWDRLKGAK